MDRHSETMGHESDRGREALEIERGAGWAEIQLLSKRVTRQRSVMLQ